MDRNRGSRRERRDHYLDFSFVKAASVGGLFHFERHLLAPLRHADGHWECLFVGVHRKSSAHLQNDANDP